MATHHLAQLNIGRLIAPPDHPSVGEFIEALDPINALADASPGFVWRLQDESGNATNIRISDDPQLAINLSVWESIESLKAFAYRSEHVDYFKRRGEWFEPSDAPYMAMWWVPVGHRPSVEEALDRLAHVRTEGPTEHAFTFARSFGPPDGG